VIHEIGQIRVVVLKPTERVPVLSRTWALYDHRTVRPYDTKLKMKPVIPVRGLHFANERLKGVLKNLGDVLYCAPRRLHTFDRITWAIGLELLRWPGKRWAERDLGPPVLVSFLSSRVRASVDRF